MIYRLPLRRVRDFFSESGKRHEDILQRVERGELTLTQAADMMNTTPGRLSQIWE